VAFVSVFSRMVRTQHEQRAELERLSAEIESLATTAERNRIAREIHDGLGHYLTVVHVQLEAAELLLSKDPERARASVQTARRLTREGLDDVRRSVAVLRGRAPVDKPLPEAIAVMAEACAAAGIEVKTEIRGIPRELSSAVAVTLFRAAQEAFTNVQRHARAKSVQVELGFDRPGRAWLRVEDDGVGTAVAEGGFGLVGLRERVSLVGGQVTIRSSPGNGFAVEVDVPA
jgi:signal transduction histidine kinase